MTDRSTLANAIVAARRRRLPDGEPARKRALEGGCGVIGIIGTERLGGQLIRRSCAQMRNRGNGKGGGIAAAGLFPEHRSHYALHIAYLDEEVRAEVEKKHVEQVFSVDHAERQVNLDDHREAGLEIRPPSVWRYFVRARAEVLERFAEEEGIDDAEAAEEELIFHNSRALNQQYYVDSESPRAFVLSHGRDLMILKGVGFAENIAEFYRLEETQAHVWIGHQRYPTRGRVWHPGGAHPFAGLHEALVHNGDFANYHAASEYLYQWGLTPQFVTDTEVSVLLFDLYSRVLGYPLEYVVEALAPTPEGDFQRLPKRRQRIYRAIHSAHLHGSPDGPWFFIVARTEPSTGAPQLIGITDVSMLRPQVFSLQVGEKSFGAIASEKQAIDAFFEELASNDPTVPPLADRYWMARGGSCTDGGAFTYTLRGEGQAAEIEVRDKFGARVGIQPQLGAAKQRLRKRGSSGSGSAPVAPALGHEPITTRADGLDGETAELRVALQLAQWDVFRAGVEAQSKRETGRRVLARLATLRDRRWDPGRSRRTELIALIDHEINTLLDAAPPVGGERGGSLVRIDATTAWNKPIAPPHGAGDVLAIDASEFPPEGRHAASRALVAGHQAGYRQFVVYRCRGDRFLGCGLGSDTADTRIDVYGASGDYLGSGLDGAQIFVHGDAQDQIGQILKTGRIVVFGDVGQTFLYGAKGGEALVMGSAGGRPLINAVGRIRAIINGTCLDYCAESFMAGAQTGGGFVIINGLIFDERGEVVGLEMKYPGNNLFSLASGGACYLNDPYQTATSRQLNGAEFVPFGRDDWNIIVEYLRENERLFGISVRHDLLMVDGVLKWPKEVFRKIVASQATEALDWSSLQ